MNSDPAAQAGARGKAAAERTGPTAVRRRVPVLMTTVAGSGSPPARTGLSRPYATRGPPSEPTAAGRRPTIVIVPDSYTWSPFVEADATELRDLTSGRSTLLRRPPPELLAMDDVIRIEVLAFRERLGSQAELFGALDSDPLRVLAGMNWTIAFWAVLWDLRAGEPADELVRTLDYDGPWRMGATHEQEQVWRSMSHRVRTGVLAALTGNLESHRVYEAEVRRLAPDVFLHVTLTIMDGLRRNLTRQGLDLQGMAEELSARTSRDRPHGPSFSPPR